MITEGTAKTIKRSRTILVAVLLVVVVAVGLYWTFTGYNTFEQTRGRDHYSFEYPASFQQTVDNRSGVRLADCLSNGSEIVVAVIVGVAPSPTARVEKVLSAEHRVLVHHTQAEMDGVQCEILTYRETDDDPLFVKQAFFEHNHRFWDFFVYAEEGHEEEVEALFQHVFDTFEILP